MYLQGNIVRIQKYKNWCLRHVSYSVLLINLQDNFVQTLVQQLVRETCFPLCAVNVRCLYGISAHL